MALNKKKLETISYRGFSVQELEQSQRNLYMIVLALEREDYREAAMVAEALQGQAADIMTRCDRFLKGNKYPERENSLQGGWTANGMKL